MVELNMANCKNVIIGNLYRPPQGDSNVCCEHLIDTVNDIVQSTNADLFLLGDFNVNQFDKTSLEYKHLHRFEILTNLRQYMQHPTRQANCIDLIYTNCDCVAGSRVLDILLSDHELIYITRTKEKTKYNRVHFTGRSYRNYVKEELRQHLEEKDWIQFYELIDPSDCWDYLLNAIKEKIDVMCPLKQTTVKGHTH